MFQQLRARLTDAGFPAINFLIINSAESINDTEGLVVLQNASGTIPVYQEPVGGSLWDNVLEGAQFHVLVVDRCGRLTYQVILPWSILNYPYVKAAILSTYNDDPCGYCVYNTVHNSNNATEEQNVKVDTNSTVPYVVNPDLPVSVTRTQITRRPVQNTIQVAGGKHETENIARTSTERPMEDPTQPDSSRPNERRPSQDLVQVTYSKDEIESITRTSTQRPMEDPTQPGNTRNKERRPIQNIIQVTNDKHNIGSATRASTERPIEDPQEVNYSRFYVGRMTVASSPPEEQNSSNEVSNTTREGDEIGGTTTETLQETTTAKPKHNSNAKKTRPYFPRKRRPKAKQDKHHVATNKGESTTSATETDRFVENQELNVKNGSSSDDATILELENTQQKNRTKLEVGSRTSVEQDDIIQEDGSSGSLKPLTAGADGTVPIRVIMHAPHSHHNGELSHDSQYLVLQTNNPRYHGHLTARTGEAPLGLAGRNSSVSVGAGARDINIGDNTIAQESSEGDSREKRKKKNKVMGIKKVKWVTHYHGEGKAATDEPLHKTNDDEGHYGSDHIVEPVAVTFSEQNQKVQKHDEEESETESLEEVNAKEDVEIRGSGNGSKTKNGNKKSGRQKAERRKQKQGEEKPKHNKHFHRTKTTGQNRHKQRGKDEGLNEGNISHESKQIMESNEEEGDTKENPTPYNSYGVTVGRKQSRIGAHENNRESDEGIDEENRLSMEAERPKQEDIDRDGEYKVERIPTKIGQVKNSEDSGSTEENKEDGEAAGARDKIIKHYSKLLPWINFQM